LSIEVIKPGLLTTIQDLGRFGFQKYGVIAGGAMDSFALRTANMAVGNPEGTAALEITLTGPVLAFREEVMIAVCGADLSPNIGGVGVPMWRPVLVPKGSTLSFGEPVAGCRAYLAAAGGFEVAPVMLSRSTYLRAGIGGWEGRALREGDRLTIGKPTGLAKKIMSRLPSASESFPFAAASWRISSHMLPATAYGRGRDKVVRALPGSEFGRFDERGRKSLFSEPFQILPQSDRMGYRLAGPVLQLSEPLEMISGAVAFGTVQVPPDGNPIVLMADRQTTGGYPKIAQVITADLPILAQARPGDWIRFREVSLREAEELLFIRELEFVSLKKGLETKYR